MAKRSEGKRIDVSIMVADKKTASGRVYTKDTLDKIIASIASGKKYTIEEVSPAERTLKKIMPFQSWSEHAMADSVAAKIDERGNLVMTFELRPNRFGKLLDAVLESNKFEDIDFFPIGIGNVNENNEVSDYQLSYVTFEVKGHKK